MSPAEGSQSGPNMQYLRIFLRVTCAKIAFVTGLGIAPAVAAHIAHPAAMAVCADCISVR